jgi:hypothetical protein
MVQFHSFNSNSVTRFFDAVSNNTFETLSSTPRLRAMSNVESVPCNRGANQVSFLPYDCRASWSKIDLDFGLLRLCMLKVDGRLRIFIPRIDLSGHSTRVQHYMLARTFCARIVHVIDQSFCIAVPAAQSDQAVLRFPVDDRGTARIKIEAVLVSVFE